MAVATTLFTGCSDEQSKEDYIAAADEVCRESDEEIRDIGDPRVGEGILEYVEQAEEVAGDLVSDLRALDPPEAGREQADRMIDALERSTRLLEPLAQAAIDRDTQELEKLQQEVEQVTDEVADAAESYGFEVCGAKVLDPVR